MGSLDLRGMNEDGIAPAPGFGRHSHRDMEAVNYALDRGFHRKGSLGNGSSHPTG